MPKEMSVKDVCSKFTTLYGPNSSTLYAQYSCAEDKELIETVIAVLNAGFHPAHVLSSNSLSKIQELTNVNFNNFIIPDALDFNPADPSLLNTTIQYQTSDSFDPETYVPSDVVCTSYSKGNNLSSSYKYANKTDIPNCSNDKINGLFCFAEHSQNKCPFFTPDYSFFASHTINEFEKQYTYKVYKYRNINSQIIINIYFDNNLIHNLSYPIEALENLIPGVFEQEIYTIIKEVHSSSCIGSDLLHVDTVYPSDVLVSVNSYMSTLLV
jgi:hypothetical protein